MDHDVQDMGWSIRAAPPVDLSSEVAIGTSKNASVWQMRKRDEKQERGDKRRGGDCALLRDRRFGIELLCDG